MLLRTNVEESKKGRNRKDGGGQGQMVHVRRITAHARVDPTWVYPEHPSPLSAP